jgi:hypothetical protein
MNELNTKIWEFLLFNQLVREEAFFYNIDQLKLKNFIWNDEILDEMDSVKSNLYKSITWLYKTNSFTSYSVIGIQHDTNKVYSISNQGDIFYICDEFKLLPYFLIQDSMNIYPEDEEEEGNVFDYFKLPHFKNKELALHQYENWFKQESLTLDSQFIFINKDGTYNKDSFFID